MVELDVSLLQAVLNISARRRVVPAWQSGYAVEVGSFLSKDSEELRYFFDEELLGRGQQARHRAKNMVEKGYISYG